MNGAPPDRRSSAGVANLDAEDTTRRRVWNTSGMTTFSTPCYKGFRFPQEIISHAVWLYLRFSLSYRDVEELLAARGVIVTHKTIRQWCQKFGQAYANQLRRGRPRLGNKWHLDEVFPKDQREDALPVACS